MADEAKRMKMAVIAGASRAMAYLKKNKYADEDEVIRHISENAHEILEQIDDPL